MQKSNEAQIVSEEKVMKIAKKWFFTTFNNLTLDTPIDETDTMGKTFVGNDSFWSVLSVFKKYF